MKYYYGMILLALSSTEAPKERPPGDALKALREHVRLQDVDGHKMQKEEYRYDVKDSENGKASKPDDESEEEDKE